MKKRRISERIFAVVLVLCMVFTIMPTNVQAALKGEVVDGKGEMGLATSDTTISADEYTTWPIEIYDYYNDGMLFEYASATGNAADFILADDNREYVELDMSTDYYTDFTKEETTGSYVVRHWFPEQGYGAYQYSTGYSKYPLKFYRMEDMICDKNGIELIDFREPGTDDILTKYGADTIDEKGRYEFENVNGYIFQMDNANTTAESSTVLVTEQENYGASNPNWAVNVLLRPTENEAEYEVIAVEKNPKASNENLPDSPTVADVFGNGVAEPNDIIMVAHANDSTYHQTNVDGDCHQTNWMDTVAANALKPGDILTKSIKYVESTPPGRMYPQTYEMTYLEVKSGEGTDEIQTAPKDDIRYAVLVYRTYDCETDLCIKPFLRDKDDNIYYGNTVTEVIDKSITTTPWAYCVMGFSDEQWSNVAEDIQSAGIQMEEADDAAQADGYWFDVSHFAMFESEGEAYAYGEKALTSNENYTLALTEYDATQPDMSKLNGKPVYVADYTSSAMKDSVALSMSSSSTLWAASYGQTYDSGEYGQYKSKYYQFTNIPNDGVELIDFYAEGNIERDKAKYAVLCFKLQGLDPNYAQIRAFVRGDQNWEKDCSPRAQEYTWCGENWQYLIFDITDAAEKNIFQYDTDEKTSDKIQSAGILINTSNGQKNYTLSVSHFAVFGDEKDAQAYIEQAKEYHKNYIARVATYNPIYSNLGFGFLEASQRAANNPLYEKFVTRLGFNPNVEGIEKNYVDENSDGTIDKDTIYYLDGNTNPDYNMENLPFNEGYTLQTILTSGLMTAGLVKEKLVEFELDGKTVYGLEYNDTVIEYLAELLETTLVIPEYTNGKFNYDFIKGEKSADYAGEDGEARDLASAIRSRIGIDFEKNDTVIDEIGDLQTLETNKENLIGSWQDCSKYINSVYDAAYYLLHNLFVPNSYNTVPDQYTKLRLNKTQLPATETREMLREAYVFDAGFTYTNEAETAGQKKYTSSIKYDTDNKIIMYHSTLGDDGKNIANVDSKAQYYASGSQTTTLFPFLPVTMNNTPEGMTKSPYFEDDGVHSDTKYGATYQDRDFNYVMKSHGTFIYDQTKGLFFEFEGDDDVYLFINGHLVLDIGGAHGITKQKFNLNDYVFEALAVPENERTDRQKALALTDGETCTFDFFYMERHGYGANCRIVTNMEISNENIDVEKTAYQYNEKNERVEIPEGGVVTNTEEKIEYNFSLTNKGEGKLFNIAFTDKNLGVEINADEGLVVNGSTVTDENGGELEPKDLIVEVTGYVKWTEESKETIRYDKVNGEMKPADNGEYVAMEMKTIEFETNDHLIECMKTIKDVLGGKTEEGDGAGNEQAGEGLWPDATIKVKGIYYTLTPEDIALGRFNNTVQGTAKTAKDGGEGLDSMDSHRLYIPGDPYYYKWTEEEIIITPDRLIDDMLASEQWNDVTEPGEGVNLTKENVIGISEVTAGGISNITTNVSIDEKNNITLHHSREGEAVFFVKITYGDKNTQSYAIVPVGVNVLDTEDSVTVLDYGLKVDLTDKNGILEDYSKVGEHDIQARILGIADVDAEKRYTAKLNGETATHILTFEAEAPVDGKVEMESGYGDFTLEGTKLTYAPDEFMEGIDTISTVVHVYEKGYEDLADLGEDINISKEVQMWRNVSVLPANVVYYEDDFPAITYDNALTEDIFTRIEGSEGLFQSPDQDTEYGQDAAYSNNSDMSGNSLTKIWLNKAEKVFVASFKFKGTGFELISRTNAYDSGMLQVKVTKQVDEKPVTVKNIPVITKFDNAETDGADEIYQVPVIRVDNLEPGIEYTVEITGVPTKDYSANVIKNTYLYIDGIRIFQPMGSTCDKYNSDENGATFSELRDLITNAEVSVVEYTEPTDDSTGMTVSSGTTTWTENQNKLNFIGSSWTGNEVGNINDYLISGPNNEVYIKADDDTKAALVFYVKQDGTYKDDEQRVLGSLQIAARAIDAGLFNGNAASNTAPEISYYALNETTDKYEWVSLATLNSSTEQYYDIDYTKCPKISDDYYQVVLKVSGDMVSFTSVKHKGLDFAPMTTGEQSADILNDFYTFVLKQNTATDGDTEFTYIVESVDKGADPGAVEHILGKNEVAIMVKPNSKNQDIFNALEEGATLTSTVSWETIAAESETMHFKDPYVFTFTKNDTTYEINGQYVNGYDYWGSQANYVYLFASADAIEGVSTDSIATLTDITTIRLRYENGFVVNAVNGESVSHAVSGLGSLGTLFETGSLGEPANPDDPSDYIRYQTRNNTDLRLIGYVDDLTKYSSVSFTIEIDGVKSKELVCTMAYSALYANGELFTVDQIFNKTSGGYFVAFTINNYLNYYDGKDVKITITYKDKDGNTTISDDRTVKVEKKSS